MVTTVHFRLIRLKRGDLTDFDVIGICPFAFNLYDLSVTRAAPGNVDLGGIGKGYAVESAACWLKNIRGRVWDCRWRRGHYSLVKRLKGLGNWNC